MEEWEMIINLFLLLAKVLVVKSATICDFVVGDFVKSETPAQYEDYAEIVNLF